MAATILIAQAIGARDITQARRVMGTSATFFIGLSVGDRRAGLVAVAAPAGGDGDAGGLAATGRGLPAGDLPGDADPVHVRIHLSAALRGAGDSRTPFRFLLVSVLLDIAFNPLLIFGIGPFPKLGIAGSAWSTLLSQVVTLGALLFYLRHKRHPLWLGRRDAHMFRIDLTILRALVVKGVPMGLQMVLISLAMIAMMTMVNHYGTDTTAAYGAALQLWTYVQMPAMAIGAACSSMAAQNVGAHRWDRVSATAQAGVLFNFLLTGALIAPLILLDRWTLALFLPEGSGALEIARHLNHISVWSFLFFGVTFVVSGVVRSTGAVIPPLLILALALWGIRVPFANLLQPT